MSKETPYVDRERGTQAPANRAMQEFNSKVSAINNEMPGNPQALLGVAGVYDGASTTRINRPLTISCDALSEARSSKTNFAEFSQALKNEIKAASDHSKDKVVFTPNAESAIKAQCPNVRTAPKGQTPS